MNGPRVIVSGAGLENVRNRLRVGSAFRAVGGFARVEARGV